MKIINLSKPRAIKKCGNGAVIFMPKKLIGKKVFVSYTENKITKLQTTMCFIIGITTGIFISKVIL